ncbi:Uncharacterised protein g9679 [Pycnogonum litorale]
MNSFPATAHESNSMVLMEMVSLVYKAPHQCQPALSAVDAKLKHTCHMDFRSNNCSYFVQQFKHRCLDTWTAAKCKDTRSTVDFRNVAKHFKKVVHHICVLEDDWQKMQQCLKKVAFKKLMKCSPPKSVPLAKTCRKIRNRLRCYQNVIGSRCKDFETESSKTVLSYLLPKLACGS